MAEHPCTTWLLGMDDATHGLLRRTWPSGRTPAWVPYNFIRLNPAADFFAWIDSATRIRLMRGEGWPPEKLIIVPDNPDDPFSQTPLEVSRVEIKGTELLVDLAKPLDPRQTYLAHWGGQTTFLVPSWHGQQKLYNYQGNDLGLTEVGDKWQFKLWSPTASQVRLLTSGVSSAIRSLWSTSNASCGSLPVTM